MQMQSHRNLIVWQKSIELVTLIYKITNTFPKSELYALTSQIRRSATSIPANIAEGKFRGSRKEFIYFLRIAYGSGAELDTHLEIANNLSFINSSDFAKVTALLVEIMKMLNKLLSSLKNLNS